MRKTQIVFIASGSLAVRIYAEMAFSADVMMQRYLTPVLVKKSFTQISILNTKQNKNATLNLFILVNEIVLFFFFRLYYSHI